jgi:predicted dehydrogenase
MTQTPIRLAILGCGFAAQQIHIPRLVQLPDSFKIVGVADIQPTAAKQAVELAGDCPTFSDLEQMLDETQPQALAVLTPLHAAPIEIALRRRVDVFAEKPLCETPADALRLASLASELQQVLVVGAMRVFDPAIAITKKIITEISPLRWVEVRDYCGAGSVTAGGDLVAGQLQAGLPVRAGFQKNLLQSLLLEFIHDISILRGVFGAPLSVQAAHASPDGWATTGELQLPDGIPCLFAVSEFGVTSAPVFDVSLRLFGEKGCAEIRFGDPNQDGHCQTIVSRNFACPDSIVSDPFTAEWQAFAQALSTRQVSINSAGQGAGDVELAWSIFAKCMDMEENT